MNQHTYVAIMAGGVGSRFWPGSRENRPKQFLDMMGTGRSLLQMTYDRFLPICKPENILIVTNSIYRDLVKEQLPDITDNQILCEPSRNNTAPSVAYTALKIADLDPNANFVIASSDHIVLKEKAFLDKISQCLDFASRHDALITLGIQPSRPDTGYGYIEKSVAVEEGIFKVKRFTEKPDLQSAQSFVNSGAYLWNAGIFIWNVQSILKAFQQHASQIYDTLKTGQGIYNTKNEQVFINQHYPQTTNISIDFAIMEKADNVFTVPAEFGWSDLGTWASLHVECPKDENENVLQGANIIAIDASNNLIRAPKDKLVVVKGLEDFIIVDEGDVLMIYPKSKEQEIKSVTGMIKSKFNGAFL